MKKKIMIFTSSGGRGHVSATQALIDYCGDDYQVQSVYALQEVLGPIDFVYTLTFGRCHSEELYNYFITHNYTWLVPAMVWIGEWFFWLRSAKITQLIEDYLLENKPDLLISVIPMVNGGTLKAVERLQIPFWVIPTDLDAQKFIYQVNNPTYTKFFFNAAYDDARLIDTFAPALISASQITYAGFPVRVPFLAPLDNKDALKLLYDIPTDKPIVMLLMGGLGSRDTIAFAHELGKIKVSVHVLLCIGKSEELRPELEAMSTTEHVTYTIIGFTEHIAELMTMSDLLITKSGGLSINEALYMELPMILDATSRGLVWEKFNRAFVEANNFGYVLESRKNLAPVVEDLLRNPDKLAQWKQNIQQLNKKNPRIEMVRVIKDLIG